MSLALALLLALPVQDPVDEQIAAYLREFEAAAEGEEALAILMTQLVALGQTASTPIARRLAEDLRDGMLSAYAPALLDALEGRQGAELPLQEAFRDAATSISGRIELASALSQLEDTQSWQDELRAIASDDAIESADRLRALDVLRAVSDTLAPPRPPLSFGAEAPRVSLLEEPVRSPRRSPAPRPPPPPEKKDDAIPGTGSMIVAAGLVVGIILLLALKRKA